MITLKQFKQIYKHIEELEVKNQALTSLMVCKDSHGWIDYSEEVIDDVFLLLYHIFDIPVEEELFHWWRWDAPEDSKYIYESDKNIKYNLNSLENLYLYASGQLDKVQEPYTEEEKERHSKAHIHSTKIVDNVSDLANIMGM